MRPTKCLTWIVVLALAGSAVNADELSDLTELLRSKDSLVCARAAEGIGTLGPRGEAAIPDLIPLLGNGAPGERPALIVYKPVRQFAADALRQIGPKSIPAIIG